MDKKTRADQSRELLKSRERLSDARSKEKLSGKSDGKDGVVKSGGTNRKSGNSGSGNTPKQHPQSGTPSKGGPKLKSGKKERKNDSTSDRRRRMATAALKRQTFEEVKRIVKREAKEKTKEENEKIDSNKKNPSKEKLSKEETTQDQKGFQDECKKLTKEEKLQQAIEMDKGYRRARAIPDVKVEDPTTYDNQIREPAIVKDDYFKMKWADEKEGGVKVIPPPIKDKSDGSNKVKIVVKKDKLDKLSTEIAKELKSEKELKSADNSDKRSNSFYLDLPPPYQNPQASQSAQPAIKGKEN